MSPLQEPRSREPNPDARRLAASKEHPTQSRKPPGAFAQQEAALQRMGAQLRAANAQIEGIKQRLQAQISPKKR